MSKCTRRNEIKSAKLKLNSLPSAEQGQNYS